MRLQVMRLMLLKIKYRKSKMYRKVEAGRIDVTLIQQNEKKIRGTKKVIRTTVFRETENEKKGLQSN